MRVELHPDAAEISAVFDRIGERPESFPRWPVMRETSPTIHRATTQRFPYVIAFERHEQNVLVLAVAHARRRPLYWLSRASR